MPEINEPRGRAYLWLLWVAVVLAITVRPFLWHLEYFRHPAPKFFRLYVGALLVLAAVSMVYIRLRAVRPRIIHWEFRSFVVFFLCFFLFYAPAATLYALWIWFVCFSLGRLLLRDLAESPLEKVTLFLSAGFGAASAALFVLGLAGLYHRWLILILLAGGALLCWKNFAALGSMIAEVGRNYAARANDPLWGLCFIFAGIFTLSSAMMALSPEIAFDPVSFHFVLARDYAATHRLFTLDRIPYSYFPQGIEVLYALGFLLEGQATAKILTYAFFPLAALTVALIAARWFSNAPSRRGGHTPTGNAQAGPLIAATLFWTVPFIAWTGSVAKNDLALALYLLLAAYSVMRWIEGNRFAWLAAGALFLGFSFGVKHVAILGAVPLAAIVLWNLRRQPIRVRQGLALLGLLACAGLFWHVRTYLLTGNPLYPEFGFSAMRSTTATGHPQFSWFERAELYLSTPWRLHFRGLSAFESPSPNPAGFILVAFFPLFFARERICSRPAKYALIFAAGYFLYWAAVLVKLRYAVAAFGVALAYLGCRLAGLSSPNGKKRPRWLAWSGMGMAAYCLIFSLTVTLIFEINVPRLKLFAGKITREQFLEESLVTYRSIAALNRVARPGEIAYSVGNCTTFYANIEFHCYYDESNNYSFQKIGRDLAETRYEYLIVSGEWAHHRHMQAVERYYHTQLLYHDESFYLFRLGRL